MWLGQFSEALDRLVPRSDLDAMLLGTAKATLRDAEAAAERHARDAAAAAITTARTEAAALRIELDRRSDGLGERLGRAEDEVAAAREGLGVLAASLGAKAEAAAVEARVRRCETEIGSCGGGGGWGRGGGRRRRTGSEPFPKDVSDEACKRPCATAAGAAA